MKIRLQAYGRKSRSGKHLAKALGVLHTCEQQFRKHGDFDLIINWGSTERISNGTYINQPEAVARACNKKASLESFKEAGVPCPVFTYNRRTAEAWLQGDHTVVARTLLRAHSGRGIRIIDPANREKLPAAPLYTQYVKKADEYRVHVFGGQVLDMAQKKKRRAVNNEDVNYQIRSWRNGWVFCREGIEVPQEVLDASVRAVDCLGLDFGAVDVGYNAKRKECCVYEVNTAPGVEGTTIESYTRALLENFPELRGGAYARRRAA